MKGQRSTKYERLSRQRSELTTIIRNVSLLLNTDWQLREKGKLLRPKRPRCR